MILNVIISHLLISLRLMIRLQHILLSTSQKVHFGESI